MHTLNVDGEVIQATTHDLVQLARELETSAEFISIPDPLGLGHVKFTFSNGWHATLQDHTTDTYAMYAEMGRKLVTGEPQ